MWLMIDGSRDKANSVFKGGFLSRADVSSSIVTDAEIYSEKKIILVMGSNCNSFLI